MEYVERLQDFLRLPEVAVQPENKLFGPVFEGQEQNGAAGWVLLGSKHGFEPPPPPPPCTIGQHRSGHEAMPKATGTDRCDILGAKLGLDYHKVNLANGVIIEKLDDWFCGLAKWSLSPECLFDNPEQFQICMTSRKQLCEGLCAVRSISVDTLKTYCNGMVRAVKLGGGPSCVVTCAKVLPRFYAVMQSFGNRFVNNNDNINQLTMFSFQGRTNEGHEGSLQGRRQNTARR